MVVVNIDSCFYSQPPYATITGAADARLQSSGNSMDSRRHTRCQLSPCRVLHSPPRATLKFERKVGLEVEKTCGDNSLNSSGTLDLRLVADDGEGDEGASAALLYFFVVLLLVLICGVQRPACLRRPHCTCVCNRANKRTSWFQLSTQMQLQKSPNTQPQGPYLKKPSRNPFPVPL